METAEWSVEDESREGSMVVVSDADIDLQTVVVHLHNTPGVGGKEEGGICVEAQNDFINSKRR